jgi:hypothetical protein
MWFVYKKVLLTKDNLVKTHLKVALNVSFVVLKKQLTILLLLAYFFHLVWSVVHLAYSIPPRVNVFGNWLNELRRKQRPGIV